MKFFTKLSLLALFAASSFVGDTWLVVGKMYL